MGTNARANNYSGENLDAISLVNILKRGPTELWRECDILSWQFAIGRDRSQSYNCTSVVGSMVRSRSILAPVDGDAIPNERV